MRFKKALKNKNAMLFILEGLAMATAGNMLAPFIQKFTERIGGNDWHIAMINSLPPLVAIIFLIPCGFIINKIHNKKLVATALLVFNSLFFIAMMIAPGLPISFRATFFVIIVGLMNWPQSLYLTTWQAFYSDTFRGPLANSIYGMRSRYVALVGVIVVLITGTVITRATNSEKSVEFIYTMIFALCFLFTILQAFLISRVDSREKRKSGALREARIAKVHLRENQEDTFSFAIFRQAFKNKKFILFCCAAFIFYFTWQMGWPIFYIYQSSKQFVGFDEFWFGLLTFSISLSSFVAYPFWTKRLTTWGTGRVMIIGAVVLVINPFMYLISTNAFWILGINILIGAIFVAFTLAIFCRTIELAPEKGKIVYFAVFNTFINTSGFIAPLVGVWIKSGIGVPSTLITIGFLRIFGLAALVFSVYFSRAKLRAWLEARKARRLG
ncbi:MAG: MFS transporter [Bacillota bacterium]